MDVASVKHFIKSGESETVEFKKSSAKLTSAAKSLCAFLNGKGGTVIIGVSDEKKIIGQHVTDHTRQEVANTLRKFEPTANVNVEYIDSGSDKQLVVITAHPDNHAVPYTFDGRAYERKESTTNKMPQNKYEELLMSRLIKPVTWGAQPSIGVRLVDLDHDEIIKTSRDITRKKRFESNIDTNNVEDILTRLKLIESGYITNAAVALFAKDIPGNYMQCIVRMARFRGIEKRHFIDSKHEFGNAFQILDQAEKFINRHTAIASRFEKGNFARIDEPEYPFEAVREALINAICHRDYASPGSSITVMIYDDRLEIINSGLLPTGINLPDLKKSHASHPRNPKITNVFFRRGFIEAMGFGIQEIIQSCTDSNMKEPEFYEQAGAFVVKMYSRHYKQPEESISNLQITKRQNTILNILQLHEKLSPQEIMDLLKDDITHRTLRNDLQALKSMNYIYSEGKGPQTKWLITNNPEIIRK